MQALMQTSVRIPLWLWCCIPGIHCRCAHGIHTPLTATWLLSDLKHGRLYRPVSSAQTSSRALDSEPALFDEFTGTLQCLHQTPSLFHTSFSPPQSAGLVNPNFPSQLTSPGNPSPSNSGSLFICHTQI